MTQIAKKFFDLINEQRRTKYLKELKWNENVTKKAIETCREMYKHQGKDPNPVPSFSGFF